MKGNKILAVIALVALTGFLWMACESGGSSSGGDSTSTESEFGNTKLPIPPTAAPTVTYNKTQSILIEGDYDEDTIYVATSNIFGAGGWVPSRVTYTITDPLDILEIADIDSAADGTTGAGTITIKQNQTTAVSGQATVKVNIRSKDNVVYSQEIKVVSMTAGAINPADPLAVVKVGPLPTGITYYDSDTVAGVWKNVNVTLTHPSFPAGFSLVVPLSDPKVTITETHFAGVGTGADDIDASTVELAGVLSTEENGIPAISVIADKVSAIAIDPSSTFTTNYRVALDAAPTLTTLTNLKFYAFWDNPRNPGATTVVGGKGRQSVADLSALGSLDGGTSSAGTYKGTTLNMTTNTDNGAYEIEILFGTDSANPKTSVTIYKYTITNNTLAIVDSSIYIAPAGTAKGAYFTAIAGSLTAATVKVDYECTGRDPIQNVNIGDKLVTTDLIEDTVVGSGSAGNWQASDVITLHWGSVAGFSTQALSTDSRNKIVIEKA